jgi:hypothetical protein
MKMTSPQHTTDALYDPNLLLAAYRRRLSSNHSTGICAQLPPSPTYLRMVPCSSSEQILIPQSAFRNAFHARLSRLSTFFLSHF